MRSALVLVAALVLLAPQIALAHHCGPNDPRPEFPRHSCRTRTQTGQVGEPLDPHPGGNPGRRPGQRVAPGASVHCQIEADNQCHCGPRRGTGRNIPCIPGASTKPKPKPPARPSTGKKSVFHYYYVNGINTPKEPDSRRGTCLWDRRMIGGNLLDLTERVPSDQSGFAYKTSITVGAEEDRFDEVTCNPSGTDPGGFDRYCEEVANGRFRNESPDTQKLAKDLCKLAPLVRDLRKKGFAGQAPGDVAESFEQALGSKDTAFVTTLPFVQDLAARISAIAAGERSASGPRETNYFILIAHSQGNFFAEGVAAALQKQDPPVFTKRLGVMSLGSPTSYESLGESFRTNRIKHFTRDDDVIVALTPLGALGNKSPWPPNLPALWPWRADDLTNKLRLTEWVWIPPGLHAPFLETMGLGPTASQCDLLKKDEAKGQDCALYGPLMNSHLLDNYLSQPTSSQQGRPIHPKIAVDLGLSSARAPEARPVLWQVRQGLLHLKQELLRR